MSNIKEPVTRDTLLKTVNTFPIIDNHAHNLLNSSASLSCPLEVCFSEARGEALQKSIETSALKRGVRQLAKLYNCEATLESVKCVTDAISYEELCRTCFDPTGIQCLLLDDGLDSLDGLRDVESHVGLVECAKRIVRIEKIAEQTISDLVISFKNSGNENLELKSFQDPFKNQLETLARSDLVVSFKSIAAYRTGLNINCDIDYNLVVRSLAKFILECVGSDGEKPKVVETRLVDKILIDYILNLAIEVAVKYDIPIQLHTGFGDNDLDLLTSNPLHLRKLIEKYPTAKIILLHSSYPYTRQAGYLASVYSNVYVDIGLVFPMISATGQETNLFELLEICPTNKILFSTDGHYLPESFYVATIQVREALGKVLLKAVENEDFTIEEAIKIAKQIMFENSNELYKLNLNPKIISNQEYIGSSARISNLALKELKHKGVKYVRLGWVDFTNMLRFRAVPIDRFIQKTVSSGITLAKCLNTLPVYGDVLVKETDFGPSGEMFMKPDLNTIVHLPYLPAHAFVHISFENKVTPDDVSYPSSSESSPYPVCLRSCLKNIVELARKEFGIDFLVGIESEFLLLRGGNANHQPYQPNAVDNTVYCAAAAYRDFSTIQTIEQILDALQDQNIELEQFHPESAPGQFEIITSPDNPLAAADKVVITRQTIYDVAAKNLLKATFIPKPFRDKEIDQSKKIYDDHHSKLSRKESFFVAGILSHLKAIAALTLPTISSYERAVIGSWTGKWISWGIENRETPIRACYLPREGTKGEMDVNFEIKCVDATANPYLALAAILCAGIDGIRKEMELKMHYCNDDPEYLSPETRAKLGITEQLPDSLADSLAELKKDEDLIKSIGNDIIKNYIALKEGELKFFKNLSKDKIYEILLERF
ncbi:5665_t:CDS:10 [Funneliformis mosseae]|uniref:Glutamine synthetase n=1 Tax=Funneliformis mosseae TaxID=27381 RepID=A0A9N9DCK7_FUNMO|nr:5665_t:CDS:10 [Funneliformis mosseae]